MYRVTQAAVALMLGLASRAWAEPVTLESPDGSLTITIGTLPSRGAARGQGETATRPAEDGQLAYRVDFHGKPVLEWSNLGLAIQDAAPLGAQVRIGTADPTSHDETWKAVAGKASTIRDHYNALTVRTTATTPDGRRLDVEARAYDDGVAFRYVVPEQPAFRDVRILNESTQFRFAKDAAIWPLISRGFQTSNEGGYHEMTIRALEKENLVNLPLLLELPGVAWVGLTEADIENYPGLYVTAVQDQNTLAARLAPRVEDIDTDANVAPAFDPVRDAAAVSVATRTPLRSPWRVLMIAAEPGRLVESNLVKNLNPPCAIADASWVMPGKTAWNWWNGNLANGVPNAGMNDETMRYYIDFASRTGLEYMLIDAGWTARMPGATSAPASTAQTTAVSSPANRPANDLTRSNPNIDIAALVAYGKSKNVRLWLWAHFRDMDRQMDAAMAQMEAWGIAGVKIDFMDRSDQWMTTWYRTVAAKAAEHHLMLDFHGAFKPDGIERTYPNVLTREGVMGAEYNKWSARETPRHNVTLAFTRMLAGPMDYTPGGFDNVTREAFVPRNRAPMVMGTRAHQAALFVVLESAFQCVADHPDAYTGQKETEFIKAVPATWDETRVLGGVPPKYITVARRNGRDWYVGSITDEPRDLDVPLTFLGEGRYVADVYADGPDAAVQPKDSIKASQPVTAQSVLKLKLALGGGAAIRITAAP